jgi:hypothetical protein
MDGSSRRLGGGPREVVVPSNDDGRRVRGQARGFCFSMCGFVTPSVCLSYVCPARDVIRMESMFVRRRGVTAVTSTEMPSVPSVRPSVRRIFGKCCCPTPPWRTFDASPNRTATTTPTADTVCWFGRSVAVVPSKGRKRRRTAGTPATEQPGSIRTRIKARGRRTVVWKGPIPTTALEGRRILLGTATARLLRSIRL